MTDSSIRRASDWHSSSRHQTFALDIPSVPTTLLSVCVTHPYTSYPVMALISDLSTVDCNWQVSNARTCMAYWNRKLLGLRPSFFVMRVRAEERCVMLLVLRIDYLGDSVIATDNLQTFSLVGQTYSNLGLVILCKIGEGSVEVVDGQALNSCIMGDD